MNKYVYTSENINISENIIFIHFDIHLIPLLCIDRYNAGSLEQLSENLESEVRPWWAWLVADALRADEIARALWDMYKQTV